MEFLRFGSSIPGEYWGCCACDIIQNLNQDPDTPASIQLVSGDGGGGIMKDRELAFAGPTLGDVFKTRIRIGTFGTRDMPNHAFFAIMTDGQCNSPIGKKWLKLMKEQGFEFLRCVDNSVWSPKKNYIFALFRNVGPHAIPNPFQPPESWTAMKQVVPEAFCADLTTVDKQKAFTSTANKGQKTAWDAGKTVILTETEVLKAGAPVIMAGLRTEFPPEPKNKREEKMKKRQSNELPYTPSVGSQHFY